MPLSSNSVRLSIAAAISIEPIIVQNVPAQTSTLIFPTVPPLPAQPQPEL